MKQHHPAAYEAYRSARQLIVEEGEEAPRAAELMADAMRKNGNREAAKTWDAIADVARALLAGGYNQRTVH